MSDKFKRIMCMGGTMFKPHFSFVQSRTAAHGTSGIEPTLSSRSDHYQTYNITVANAPGTGSDLNTPGQDNQTGSTQSSDCSDGSLPCSRSGAIASVTNDNCDVKPESFSNIGDYGTEKQTSFSIPSSQSESDQSPSDRPSKICDNNTFQKEPISFPSSQFELPVSNRPGNNGNFYGDNTSRKKPFGVSSSQPELNGLAVQNKAGDFSDRGYESDNTNSASSVSDQKTSDDITSGILDDKPNTGIHKSQSAPNHLDSNDGSILTKITKDNIPQTQPNKLTPVNTNDDGNYSYNNPLPERAADGRHPSLNESSPEELNSDGSYNNRSSRHTYVRQSAGGRVNGSTRKPSDRSKRKRGRALKNGVARIRSGAASFSHSSSDDSVKEQIAGKRRGNIGGRHSNIEAAEAGRTQVTVFNPARNDSHSERENHIQADFKQGRAENRNMSYLVTSTNPEAPSSPVKGQSEAGQVTRHPSSSATDIENHNSAAERGELIGAHQQGHCNGCSDHSDSHRSSQRREDAQSSGSNSAETTDTNKQRCACISVIIILSLVTAVAFTVTFLIEWKSGPDQDLPSVIVGADITVRVNESFQPEMSDKTSRGFKRFEQSFCKNVEETLEPTVQQTNCTVLNLTKGSIVVTAHLQFAANASETETELYGQLTTHTANDNEVFFLGTLEAFKDSLQITDFHKIVEQAAESPDGSGTPEDDFECSKTSLPFLPLQYTYPDNCSEYQLCIDGESSLMSCADGHEFTYTTRDDQVVCEPSSDTTYCGKLRQKDSTISVENVTKAVTDAPVDVNIHNSDSGKPVAPEETDQNVSRMTSVPPTGENVPGVSAVVTPAEDSTPSTKQASPLVSEVTTRTKEVTTTAQQTFTLRLLFPGLHAAINNLAQYPRLNEFLLEHPRLEVLLRQLALLSHDTAIQTTTTTTTAKTADITSLPDTTDAAPTGTTLSGQTKSDAENLPSTVLATAGPAGTVPTPSLSSPDSDPCLAPGLRGVYYDCPTTGHWFLPNRTTYPDRCDEYVECYNGIAYGRHCAKGTHFVWLGGSVICDHTYQPHTFCAQMKKIGKCGGALR